MHAVDFAELSLPRQIAIGAVLDKQMKAAAPPMGCHRMILMNKSR